MKLTDAEKSYAYGKGLYKFKAPPVCTALWDKNAWIRWIDRCDGWYNIREAEEISHEDLEAAAEYYDKL